MSEEFPIVPVASFHCGPYEVRLRRDYCLRAGFFFHFAGVAQPHFDFEVPAHVLLAAREVLGASFIPMPQRDNYGYEGCWNR